jgi:hypothetical protein
MNFDGVNTASWVDFARGRDLVSVYTQTAVFSVEQFSGSDGRIMPPVFHRMQVHELAGY